MHNKIIKLMVEHAQIKGLLKEIENFLRDMPPVSYVGAFLKRFYNLWNKHEKEEEIFLERHRDFNIEQMILEEHRQLRGHWKVLQIALSSNDENRLYVALDTDGRMLIDKFYKHIELEEKLLSRLIQKV